MSDHQQNEQGTPIAFADVRVGDVVRATMHKAGVEIAYAGPVTEAPPGFIVLGQKGCSIASVSGWTLTLLGRPTQWRKLSSPHDDAKPGRRYQVELRGGRKVTGTLTCWMYDSATNIHTLTVAGEGVLLLDVVAMWEEVSCGKE